MLHQWRCSRGAAACEEWPGGTALARWYAPRSPADGAGPVECVALAFSSRRHCCCCVYLNEAGVSPHPIFFFILSSPLVMGGLHLLIFFFSPPSPPRVAVFVFTPRRWFLVFVLLLIPSFSLPLCPVMLILKPFRRLRRPWALRCQDRVTTPAGLRALWVLHAYAPQMWTSDRLGQGAGAVWLWLWL